MAEEVMADDELVFPGLELGFLLLMWVLGVMQLVSYQLHKFRLNRGPL
jgi:hypothetical protein